MVDQTTRTRSGARASFRNLNVVAHRWLGLATSLVLVVAGLTGVLLVWPLGDPFTGTVAHFHVDMGLGRAGALVVLVSTWISVFLIAMGLYLWWQTKRIRIRTGSGWRTLAIDIHYSLGFLTLLITLLIAATGGLRQALSQSTLRKIVSRLHTAAGFPFPIKVVYALGSTVFVVEGVTGVLMWAQKQGRQRKASSR